MMDEIKIEKDVPMPKNWGIGGRWAFLADMGVGDSAFLPRRF